MANTLNGNTFYVDATSAASGSYIESKDVIVEAFIVAAGANNGAITVSDLKKENGAFVAGDTKLKAAVLANTTTSLSLDKVPITFPNGIWVTVDATITATLVLRFKG